MCLDYESQKQVFIELVSLYVEEIEKITCMYHQYRLLELIEKHCLDFKQCIFEEYYKKTLC